MNAQTAPSIRVLVGINVSVPAALWGEPVSRRNHQAPGLLSGHSPSNLFSAEFLHRLQPVRSRSSSLLTSQSLVSARGGARSMSAWTTSSIFRKAQFETQRRFLLHHKTEKARRVFFSSLFLVSPLNFRQHYKDIQIIGQRGSRFPFQQYKKQTAASLGNKISK